MASSDLSQTLEGASKDFAEGRYSEAYSAFLLALPEVDASSDPVAAGAIHTNCGACLLGLGKVEEALEEYNRALELDSTNTNALHNKGVACTRLGQLEEAVECFKQVLEADGGFLQAYRGLVSACMTKEAFAEALEWCDKALEVSSSDGALMTDRANILLKLGQLKDAIVAYEAVLDQEGAGKVDGATVRKLYGVALSQQAVAEDTAGNLEAAEELYSKAIAIEATHTRLFNRAFLFMRVGKLDDAVEGFRQVVEVQPDNTKARAALGTLLLQQGKYEMAIPHLQVAASASSGEDFVDVAYNLGFAQLKAKRFTAAATSFKRVLESDPSNENAKNGLKAAQHAASMAASEPTGEAVQGEPVQTHEPVPAEQAQAAAAPAAAAAAHEPAATPKGEAASPTPTSAGGASEAQTIPLEQLVAPPFPDGVDPSRREEYLSEAEFQEVFKMDVAAFRALPKWKRTTLKKKASLF